MKSYDVGTSFAKLLSLSFSLSLTRFYVGRSRLQCLQSQSSFFHQFQPCLGIVVHSTYYFIAKGIFKCSVQYSPYSFILLVYKSIANPASLLIPQRRSMQLVIRPKMCKDRSLQLLTVMDKLHYFSCTQNAR